tara:strand:- start:207 stop:725 length:519 start_codon:yes stop_codon:yes gene_type:complete
MFISKKKAFFLDRDGVIIKDVGHLISSKQIKFLRKIFKTLKFIQNNNFLLIIITNQSVVGRKLISKQKLNKIHITIKKKLKMRGIYINDIFYCPHHPTEAQGSYKIKCLCRKPGNLMLKKAIKKWNIDADKSFMIGDKFSDRKCAKSTNIKFFFPSKLDLFKQVKKKIKCAE